MMQSKFHLLSIGQHFEWEGRHYVKTKPLIASLLPEGGDKFIPRSALVTLETTESATLPAKAEPLLERELVHGAVTRYHQLVQQLLAGDDREKCQALEKAYRALLAKLNL